MQPFELFKSLLKKSAIRKDDVNGFEKYTVLNSHGALFTVGFNSDNKKYGFGRSGYGKKEFARLGISIENLPDYKTIYNTVKRQYQTELVNYMFDLMLDQNEINAKENEDVEIYYATNEIGTLFSISFDKKSHKYSIMRTKQMEYLYKILQISSDIEPNALQELHQHAKSEYNWQVVRDTVDSMHDFTPDYHNKYR